MQNERALLIGGDDVPSCFHRLQPCHLTARAGRKQALPRSACFGVRQMAGWKGYSKNVCLGSPNIPDRLECCYRRRGLHIGHSSGPRARSMPSEGEREKQTDNHWEYFGLYPKRMSRVISPALLSYTLRCFDEDVDQR